MTGAEMAGRTGRRAVVSGALAVTLLAVSAVAVGEPRPDERVWPEWVRALPELADDPRRARQLLVAPEPDDAARPDYLPRVSALVREWLWHVDDGWLARAGPMLEAAVAGTADRPPDGRSARILAALVREVARPAGPGGLPDRLRPALGRAVAAYLPDLYWVVVTGEAGPPVQSGQRLRQLTEPEVLRFLADLGRNAQARETVMAAAEAHAALLYDRHFSGGGGRDALLPGAKRRVVPGIAGMFGALDAGASWELFLTLGEDLIGLVNYQTGDMRSASRKRLVEHAMMAVYRDLDPETLPDDTVAALRGPDGELVPIEEWWHKQDSPEHKAWVEYLGGPGAVSLARILPSELEPAYDRAFDRVVEDLTGR